MTMSKPLWLFENGIHPKRRPGERRDPYAVSRVLRDAVRRLSRNNTDLWLMVWTAPYGISCARMRLLEISDKGAVREADYPHWNGYVEAFFSAAWGRCAGAGGVAQATWPQADRPLSCRSAAPRAPHRGLRLRP